ncbi:MAG: VWA domain-containing protein, partial [Verrucomicrobiota bacterium]
MNRIASFLLSAVALSLSALSLPQPAQAQADTEPSSVIIVLDASGSMWEEIDGRHKIEIARDSINSLINGWTSQRKIGLMAFGHREKGNCEDIELLIAPGAVDKAAFTEAVNSIVPKGSTPLSQAVRLAAKELRYTETAASVILVSDGEETCNQDPCVAARELEAAGIGFPETKVTIGPCTDTGFYYDFDRADPFTP